MGNPLQAPKKDPHRSVRTRTRKLALTHILPNIDQWDRCRSIPRTVFRTFAELGMTGLMVPREWGGAGLDLSYLMAVVNELMRYKLASPAVSLLMPAGTICPLLARYGTRENKEILLRPIVEGKFVASLAVTEPNGGSDLLNSACCSAVSDGDCWVINGEKIFITNAPIADIVLVLARTDMRKGPFSMSLIAMRSDTPGFELVEQHEKLGLHASPTGRLRFRDCRVLKTSTVGDVNHGYAYVSKAISDERLLIAAGSVAFAEICLRDTIRYVQIHRHFSPPIPQLVLYQAELEACRAYVRSVVCRSSLVGTRIEDACIAKFAICDKAQRIIEECAQLQRLEGLREDSGIDKALDDARALSIMAGSSDTMRDIVGTALVRRRNLMRRVDRDRAEIQNGNDCD